MFDLGKWWRKIVSLFDNINPAYKVRAELEARIKELDAEISRLKQEVVTCSDTAVKRKAQIEALQDELRQSRIRLERAVKICVSLRLELQDLQHTLDNLIREAEEAENFLQGTETNDSSD